jgi:hypothetical protein
VTAPSIELVKDAAAFKGNPTHRVLVNGEYVGRIVKVGNRFQARARTTRPMSWA